MLFRSKSAAILSIEKDENPALSVVKALKVRDGSPLDVPLMLFGWDREKKMHVYRREKSPEDKEKRKLIECFARGSTWLLSYRSLDRDRKSVV